jgi:hypothetical protein
MIRRRRIVEGLGEGNDVRSAGSDDAESRAGRVQLAAPAASDEKKL